MTYLAPAMRATVRAQRDPRVPNRYAADFIRKRILIVSNLQPARKEHGKGDRIGSRPNGRSVLELTSRLVPHLRVRGAEAVQGSGQSGGTHVGAHDDRPSDRHAVTCTGGCLVDCRISVTRDVPCTLWISFRCVAVSSFRSHCGLRSRRS